MTVASTPTTKMDTLMTQIISISEACKDKSYYTLVASIRVWLEKYECFYMARTYRI
jgi:hypothetical protein